MMNLIKRLLRRIFRSLISYYGPAVLTILFAVAQGLFFPETPLWLVPLFFVFVIV
ncbi:TPA: hypothetical protein MD910_005249, partial [Klebsiella pneumoniae]|nr:hypothetical protein [Klebsiella pneumoniae]HBV5605463.1 hypothetical protein [Klebsiella pneumoniae]HBV9242895.1 hypothetical protein [Klebsiella pneumoniae]HCD1652174.1 hypothetical protein [Klebsiella pneumoniae]HEE1419194.1 hypothetical protein [Klebsiella pneumoniae]